MRVLIVDDESLIRMDLRDIIESCGHEVVAEGTNGVEALALCKKHKPDIILMDVKMPELDGIEAARQIGFHHEAPVVLLTSYSQQDLIDKARDSGVYGYLIKPVREEQLVPTLEMALGRYKSDAQLREKMTELEQSLEDRKIIQKGTGILMKLYSISEVEAYNRIRTLSMNKQISIIETCNLIIKQSNKSNNI
ncbi:ANTAR domain-containing response regulator [Veillonella parvula]|uniref:ANTAR domain-containing response regulator n=1 Tax=Veillonella parvula TaxID=29466 RepID=UPI0007672B66|nr:response regulator [Veillonella parvula]KXB87966.1 response regulator receiver domain protein [Veillonella parvula]